MLWIWILLAAAALLVAGVVWFVARPLRNAGVAPPPVPRHELELVRDRLLAQLNEIDAERADRGMDDRIAQDEELRASAELAAVLKQLDAAGSDSQDSRTAARTRPLWLVALLVLGIGLPLLAIGLYAMVNGPTLEGMASIADGDSGTQANVPPMVLEMVAKLEKQLASQPNDPAGWARLGRSYYVLGRKSDAFKAYAKAYQLAPNNPDIVSDYAWITFTENPNNTTGAAYTLYSQLYKLEPDNPDALWFLGLAAYHRGKLDQTVTYWQHLVALVPNDNPAHDALVRGIAQVKAQMKDPAHRGKK